MAILPAPQDLEQARCLFHLTLKIIPLLSNAINSALVYTGAMHKYTNAVPHCRLVIFDGKFV
ncbi:MAG: hypothetical protein F6J90_37950 [Moorea sp. SIOASIH]|uniref:hypothetical protein n=1 Tax=Moorena sp. SIOASIH TaxID=2607817 RepID=UPI0013BC9DA2|nr:hypothetical protein [Moorena sp. SIOASIH]NEO41800.1 hypothetical protein [Moorena sp. SIOASIH]